MNIDAQHEKNTISSISTNIMWCSQPQLPFLDVSYFYFQLHGKNYYLSLLSISYTSPLTHSSILRKKTQKNRRQNLRQIKYEKIKVTLCLIVAVSMQKEAL